MKTPRLFLPLVLALAVLPVGALALDATGRIPVGPEMTPGDADSVYRIVTPGSYYLAGNLVGAAGKSGIEIATSHVTLDLNGFTIQGTAQSLDGIRVVAPTDPEDITIRNGSIDGCGLYGISLYMAQDGLKGETTLIEGVRVSRNSSGGIRAALYATMRDCVASNNGSTGIQAIGGATLEGCVSIGNGGSGIVLPSGSARGCTASENTWIGIIAGSGAIVADCSANNNLSGGFSGQNGVSFQRCAAHKNDQFGFNVSGSAVEDCIAHMNTEGGIRAGWASRIKGNTVIGYLVSNDRSTLRYGILITGEQCEVVENTISSSSTAIRAVVQPGANIGANHIEGNRMIGNQYGLKVESINNVIVGNTARNVQRNYMITATNRVGSIIWMASSAIINGNSGGGSGTTDPWSNIAY